MAEPIKVWVEVDISNLKSWLKQAELVARDTKKKLDADSIVKMEANIAVLQQDLREARALLRDYQKQWNKDAIVEAQVNVNRLQWQLTEAKKNLRDYTNTGEVWLSRFGKAFKNLWNEIKVAAAGIVSSLWLLELLAFFKRSFLAASEFEKQLARINTVVWTSQKELGWLWKEINNISINYGIAANELANTAFNIVSAGVSLENASAVLDLSAKVAVGAVTDTTTAFNGLIAVIKGYNLNLTEASDVADKFFITNKLGQLEIGELANSIGRVTANARTAGLSLEGLLATYIAAARVSGNVNEVTTQLKGALNAIAAPTKEARAEFDRLGISVWQTAIEQNGLANISKEIVDAVDGNREALRRLIPEQEALQLVLTLGTSQTQAYNDAVDALTNSQGALSGAAQQFYKTDAFKLAQAQQRIAKFTRDTGKILSIVASSIITFGSTIWEFFESLAARLAEPFAKGISIVWNFQDAVKSILKWNWISGSISNFKEASKQDLNRISSQTDKTLDAIRSNRQRVEREIQNQVFGSISGWLWWQSPTAPVSSWSSVNRVTKSVKELRQEIDKLDRTDSPFAKKLRDNYEDLGESIDDSIDKIVDLSEEISKIDDEINDLWESSDFSLAERVVEAQDQIWELRDDLKELDTIASADPNRDPIKINEQRIDLLEEIADLEKEIALGTTQDGVLEQLDDARERASETEVERIIRERDEKLLSLEEERQALEEQKNQQLQNFKELAQASTELWQAYKRSFDEPLRISEERFKNMLSLAKELQNLTWSTIGQQVQSSSWVNSTNTVNQNVTINVSGSDNAQDLARNISAELQRQARAEQLWIIQ